MNNAIRKLLRKYPSITFFSLESTFKWIKYLATHYGMKSSIYPRRKTKWRSLDLNFPYLLVDVQICRLADYIGHD